MSKASIVTVSEAALIFQRSAATIRQWADSGKLPCVRAANGTRVFKRSDVERLLAAKAQGGASEKRA